MTTTRPHMDQLPQWRSTTPIEIHHPMERQLGQSDRSCLGSCSRRPPRRRSLRIVLGGARPERTEDHWGEDGVPGARCSKKQEATRMEMEDTISNKRTQQQKDGTPNYGQQHTMKHNGTTMYVSMHHAPVRLPFARNTVTHALTSSKHCRVSRSLPPSAGVGGASDSVALGSGRTGFGRCPSSPRR